jgi:competence protein ComEC
MTSRSFGFRAPLLWLVVPMMAGLAIGRAGGAAPLSALLGAALGAALAALWLARRDHAAWPVAIGLAGLCAGHASYLLHRPRIAAREALPPREARVELRLDRVFHGHDPRKVSGLATIVGTGPHLAELRGQRVYLSLALRRDEPAPLRSTVLAVVGVLAALPADPPRHSFDGYLANAGMNFRLTRGRVVATVQPPGAYHKFCRRALARFAAILTLGVGEKRPEIAGVLRAMLLGQQHELSDEQGTLFMRSGTMHLFAISGLHIGVIAVGLHALLALLRLPGGVRFVLSGIALWLYVDITGGTPSAVRAFLMVTLLQASLLLRAPGNPLAALGLSAFIVVVVWPLQIFSASFQLSYGIVAALLLLGLPLSDAWTDRWPLFAALPKATWRWYHHALDDLHRKCVAAVAIGVASTLVSTLLGVFYFNLFTPAALLANLVLIPVSSLVILGGFAALVVGLPGGGAVAALFNHATVLVLWGIDAGVRVCVALPHAWKTAEFTAPWIGPVAVLALFAALGAGYLARWRPRAGGWWPPLAIVVLTLVLGVTYR